MAINLLNDLQIERENKTHAQNVWLWVDSCLSFLDRISIDSAYTLADMR